MTTVSLQKFVQSICEQLAQGEIQLVLDPLQTYLSASAPDLRNDLWQVIAIHHTDGELQTNAKGDKRFVNEGVLMSAIKSDRGSLWPEK